MCAGNKSSMCWYTCKDFMWPLHLICVSSYTYSVCHPSCMCVCVCVVNHLRLDHVLDSPSPAILALPRKSFCCPLSPQNCKWSFCAPNFFPTRSLLRPLLTYFFLLCSLFFTYLAHLLFLAYIALLPFLTWLLTWLLPWLRSLCPLTFFFHFLCSLFPPCHYWCLFPHIILL